MYAQPDMIELFAYFVAGLFSLGILLLLFKFVREILDSFTASQIYEKRIQDPYSIPRGNFTDKRAISTLPTVQPKPEKRQEVRQPVNQKTLDSSIKQQPLNKKAENKEKICAECGSNMVVREAKYGRFKGSKFYGCESFPRCKNIVPIPGKTKVSSEEKAVTCYKCKSPMIVREAKSGPNKGSRFYGCTSFPKCKNTINIPNKTQAKPQEKSVTCSRCGKPMVIRTAQRGENKGSKFYGCSSYPECKNTKDI